MSRSLNTQPDAFTATSFDGTVIHYDIYDSETGSLILVIPGFWRDRRHPSMTRVAQLLVANGYRAAVVDVRGHGESEGRYGFNLHEHLDINAVAEDLLRRTSAKAITLLGFSYGGAIAISTAARHPLPINALLLISPVADYRMIAPRFNPLTIHHHIAFSQAFKRPRVAWLSKRKATFRALDDIREVHVPVCFVHVKDDWLISHSHSEALYEKAREPKELHLLDVPGNWHADRIFVAANDAIEPIVLEFLGRYANRGA